MYICLSLCFSSLAHTDPSFLTHSHTHTLTGTPPTWMGRIPTTCLPLPSHAPWSSASCTYLFVFYVYTECILCVYFVYPSTNPALILAPQTGIAS